MPSLCVKSFQETGNPKNHLFREGTIYIRNQNAESKPIGTVDELRAVIGLATRKKRDLSPATHVAEGKNIPPFLILHVADRPDTKAQSHWFADKLKAAGVSAQVVAAEGKTHGTINSDLGLPDDKPTQALWEFLAGVLKK